MLPLPLSLLLSLLLLLGGTRLSIHCACTHSLLLLNINRGIHDVWLLFHTLVRHLFRSCFIVYVVGLLFFFVCLCYYGTEVNLSCIVCAINEATAVVRCLCIQSHVFSRVLSKSNGKLLTFSYVYLLCHFVIKSLLYSTFPRLKTW